MVARMPVVEARGHTVIPDMAVLLGLLLSYQDRTSPMAIDRRSRRTGSADRRQCHHISETTGSCEVRHG